MCAQKQHRPQRGIVISDLHLFTRRSHGLAHFELVRPKLGSVDVLVLNGDTFDFRWSTFRNEQETLDAAQKWLLRLVEQSPRCQVHLVLGNHDCLPAFEARLKNLTAACPRFHWHEYRLQLGKTLFLHGDCVHREMDATRLHLYREVWKRHKQRSKFAGAAYSHADRLVMARLLHKLHFPKRKTVERIIYYLDRSYPEWRKDTQDCFFGHTHVPFANHLHEGVRFHNTGSAIRNMRFHPMTFQTSTENAP